MLLKDFHILVPGACEYVSFCGKGHVPCVIKLGILRSEDSPGFSKWAQDKYKGPYKEGGRRVRVREKDLKM